MDTKTQYPPLSSIRHSNPQTTRAEAPLQNTATIHHNNVKDLATSQANPSLNNSQYTKVSNRRPMLCIGLSAILVSLLALCIGSDFIPPSAIVDMLFNPQSVENTFVLETLRLPRIVMAMLAGASLAVSGLVLQALIRNPLASPDLIGITGGASVAVVFYFGWLASSVSISWLPLIASIGAAIVAFTIYLLAWSEGVQPIKLILIGIGISAATSSMTTLLMLFSSDMASLSAYTWLTGSVYGSNWQDVQQILPWALIPIPLILSVSKTLDAMQLGDALATGLGINIQPSRAALLLLSVILASSAVAYTGAISFVGLLAPHIARSLIKGNTLILVPAAALIGGQLVVLADLAGRALFGPLDLPAGIFVSAIGAPFFIFLLYRRR